MTMSDDEPKEFSFANKSEYEKELSRLLSEIERRRKSKVKKTDLETKYEEVIEEYLRFCGSEGGDGQE